LDSSIGIGQNLKNSEPDVGVEPCDAEGDDEELFWASTGRSGSDLIAKVKFSDGRTERYNLSSEDGRGQFREAVEKDDSSMILISTRDRETPTVSLTAEAGEERHRGGQWVKFDMGALKEFAGALNAALGALRAEGLNADQVVGIRVNDKAMALFINNKEGIVGAMWDHELRTFKFTYDDSGKVVKAEGKVI